MPAADTCCCWKTVKSGSYACGTYTLILYTALFVAGIVHVQTLSKTASMLGFCLLMVVLSGTCVLCSVIMLIGLFRNNRYLLLPWTVSVSMTTLIDVMVSFYLIRDAIDEPFLAVLFVTDVLICAINVYALLCVLSQYQEYKMGQVAENVVQTRDQEAAIEQPQRPPGTASASLTDDMHSSSALLLPPTEKLGIAGPSTPKFMHCELTTISEEMHPGSPTSPKELCSTAFNGSPTKTNDVEVGIDVHLTTEI